MLQKLSLHGLRGYADPVELRPAVCDGNAGSGLTVITGPNNSGKSTLVEAFKMIPMRGNTPSFNVGMRNSKTDFVDIEFQFDQGVLNLKSLRPGSSETELTINPNFRPPVYYVPSRRYFSPAFGRGRPSDRQEFMDLYSQNARGRAPEIPGFERRLFQIERNQTQFNEVVKRIFPDLISWSIDQHETGQHFMKFTSSEKSHSSEGVGEGIISAFVIVAALYDSAEGDIIVIDEPELSLHPQVQKRLMDLFEEFSSNRQILISTHSPYFLSAPAIQAGCEICRTWDRDGIIELYQISIQLSDSLHRLVTNNLNNPHVFGLDAREVFFLEDRVTVFEGQEDVVLWSKVAPGDHSDMYSIFGWGAGGASNVSAVLSVLEGLGFQKVAAILDNDRPDELHQLRASFPTYFVSELPAADIRTKPAVKARPEKEGLLNTEGEIRAEHRQATDHLMSALAGHMKD